MLHELARQHGMPIALLRQTGYRLRLKSTLNWIGKKICRPALTPAFRVSKSVCTTGPVRPARILRTEHDHALLSRLVPTLPLAAERLAP